MSARENPLRRAPQGVSIYFNGWAFALAPVHPPLWGYPRASYHPKK